MAMDINAVLNYQFVKDFIKGLCGTDIECVRRIDDQGFLTSFIVSKKGEAEQKDLTVNRVIILPPKGYTANAPNQTNAHDEVERARVKVKGGVREGKRGFSKLKDCLLIVAFHRASNGHNDVVSSLDAPYRTFNEDRPEDTPDMVKTIHSAGNAEFLVVEPDGTGFYHNLINLSNNWLVLGLSKRLRLSWKVDIEPYIAHLSQDKAELLRALHRAIEKHGDELFGKHELSEKDELSKKHAKLVEDVCAMSPQETLPALAEMIHIFDTGRHEACTVFAIILKIGKKEPQFVIDFLEQGIRTNDVPAYYARQLIGKIKKAIASQRGPLPEPGQAMG